LLFFVIRDKHEFKRNADTNVTDSLNVKNTSMPLPDPEVVDSNEKTPNTTYNATERFDFNGTTGRRLLSFSILSNSSQIKVS